MVFGTAACGTTDGSDDASAGKSGAKSSELTGYDVSGVKKDDDIAKMLPDYVTKDVRTEGRPRDREFRFDHSRGRREIRYRHLLVHRHQGAS